MKMPTRFPMVFAGVLLLASMDSHAFSLEFKTIYFPEGRPTEEEASVDVTTILESDQADVLKELSIALKANPQLGGDVEGFSDENECGTSVKCMDLSFRRAVAVFRWLRGSGLRAEQLRGPRGLSTQFTNYRDPAERHFNRRAYLAPYVLTEKSTGAKP